LIAQNIDQDFLDNNAYYCKKIGAPWPICEDSYKARDKGDYEPPKEKEPIKKELEF
jgi:hypothetical protein